MLQQLVQQLVVALSVQQLVVQQLVVAAAESSLAFERYYWMAQSHLLVFLVLPYYDPPNDSP